MSGRWRPGALLRLAIATACACIAGGALSVPIFAAATSPDLITQVADPDVDSAFVAATPMQMVVNTAGLSAMGGALGVIYGSPVFVLLGLPLHGLMLKRRLTAWPVYALAGAIVSGVAVGGLMGGLGSFWMSPWFAFAGAIATSVFWVIRRPDRISAAPPPQARAQSQPQ